jgi:hypothetical protein
MSILAVMVWFAASVTVGMYARNYRNRDQGGWTILALLISPLLAWLFVVAVSCKPVYERIPLFQHPRHDERPAAAPDFGGWPPPAKPRWWLPW